MVLQVVTNSAGQVVEFRSSRLQGTAIAAADAEFLAEMHDDPDVMAWIGGVRNAEACETWLAENISHWDQHGFGYWTLRTLDGSPVGRGGLRWIDQCVGESLVEVGYSFRRSAWGRGLATEATKAFISVAESHYQLTELGAIVIEGNDASVNVLEKAGFAYERMVEHHDGPCRFFRLPLATKYGHEHA